MDAAIDATATDIDAGENVAGTSASGFRDEHLRAVLSESAHRLACTRVDSSDSEAMLHAIVAGALEAIPAAAAASITLIDSHGVLTTRAPSDDVVAEVDGVQAELGEGPCVDALREAGSGVTDVPDLSDPARTPWPRLAPRARAAGFASVLSYQLVTNGSAGALNLWGGAPGRFSDHDRLLGALFADQAAVALAGARRAGELTKALTNRDVIGRAKGVLMERFQITDRAFAMLVESSQNTNLKLADVATWLVQDAEAGYTRRNATARGRET